MRSFIALALTALAAAAPVEEVRQENLVFNDLINADCRDVVFIFARGSGEDGNMGAGVGLPISEQLKVALTNKTLATQGVDYGANFWPNFEPKGTSQAAIDKMKELVNLTVTKCPKAQIIVGGYSQGAAVVHNAIGELPADVVAHINAAVTFGDSMAIRHNGRIPNFPPEKTLMICNAGDIICEMGIILVFGPHLNYTARFPEVIKFLTEKLQ